MIRTTSRPRALWFLVLSGSLCPAQALLASVSVSVDQNCSARNLEAGDFTANAIVPASEADGCTLTWTSAENPVTGNTTVTLFHGQPGQVVDLASEPLRFAPDPQAGFIATRRFSREALGSQSFVTVLLTSGGEVLQWTAWTVRTAALPPQPPPAANQSLDVRLGALHLENARGRFPRAAQAEGVVWKAVGEEALGYDLDGGDTGSPGVHVSVSNAWTPTDVAAASVREALHERVESIAGITNHQVKLGDLEWIETSPELVRYQDATASFERRHYYSVITIWTDAAARPIGGRNPKRFAHETSASAWKAEEVPEWASYLRSEYTADPRLLQVIARYAQRERAIPGFSHTPVTHGGDDGTSTFSLRFIARLRPWVSGGDGPDNDPRFKAGIESFAVVGSRTGLGTAEIVQESEEQGALCSAFSLFCGDTRVESAELPRGWYREASSAHLTNAQGNIPIVQSAPQIAQHYTARVGALDELRAALQSQYRGVMKGEIALRSEPTLVLADEGGNAFPLSRQVPLLSLSQLPDQAYFVLGAKLRAGALVRKDGFGPWASYRMIPVNSYAQYVVRISVIKDAAAVLTGAPTRDVQDPAELGKDQPIRKRTWFDGVLAWFGSLPLLLRVALIAIPLLLIMWFVAPLRPILVALGKLIGALIGMITRPLAALARRKKDGEDK